MSQVLVNDTSPATRTHLFGVIFDVLPIHMVISTVRVKV